MALPGVAPMLLKMLWMTVVLTPRIFLIFFWNRKKREGRGDKEQVMKQNKPGFQSKSDGLYFFFFLNPSEGLSQVQLSGLKCPGCSAYQSILG